MEFARLLVVLILLVSIAILFLGLYKPWIVLWWEDVQNRRKVIKVYGTIILISFAVYVLLNNTL